MSSSDDVPSLRSTIFPADLPPFASWDQVEQFVANVPPPADLTPDQVKQSFEFLARFRKATAHLPSPIPRRVGKFLIGIFDAAM